jgi:hypothetical protein
MKRLLTLGLPMLAGIAIGATAIQGLHAQAKPPTYAVIAVRKINDAATYKTGVLDKAAPIITAAGGHFVVRTDQITSLDGTPPARFVLIQFRGSERA